jgi:hypothetical protein
MKLYLDEFIWGVQDQLCSKTASLISTMPNENILPSFEAQRKWRYVLTPEGMRLSDGDKVYGFALPEPAMREIAEIDKLEDSNLLDFEKNKLTGGTAQVHRSSPDQLYVTLADGRLNPTFTLEHSRDKKWKYIPSKKLQTRLEQLARNTAPVEVDPAQVLVGGVDMLKSAMPSFNLDLDGASDMVNKGLSIGGKILDFKGSHPLLMGLGTLWGARKLSQLQGHFNPEYAAEMAQAPGKRFNREIGLPLMASLAVPAAINFFKQ